MNPVQITSYRGAELPLMLSQYKDSTNLKNLLGVPLDMADQLELALFEIRDWFYLAPPGLPSAEGVQLDVIGSVFGVARNPAESDADYCGRIQLRAASTLSGTPNDIIFAVQAFYGGSYCVYDPVYPAGFTIETDVVISKAQLEALAPAGVGVVQAEPLEWLSPSGLAPIQTQTGSYIYIVSV